MGAKFRRKVARGQANRRIKEAAKYLDARLNGMERALTVVMSYLGETPGAKERMQAIFNEMNKPPVEAVATPDPATNSEFSEPPAATD